MVDVQGGKLTYGQRIELGAILCDAKKSPSERFVEAIACLHPGWKPSFGVRWFDYYERIVRGVEFWMKQEAAKLHYEPDGDELAAGFRELGDKLGPMMTVMTLAEKFGKDPDEILLWEYGKVFGLLYADLESCKYGKRYRKIAGERAEARARQRRLARR